MHDDGDCAGVPRFEPREDTPVPLGQEENLDMVGSQLVAAIDPLSGPDGSLALIAAGLELLPAGRCTAHYRAALIEIRGEVDRLLGEIADA